MLFEFFVLLVSNLISPSFQCEVIYNVDPLKYNTFGSPTVLLSSKTPMKDPKVGLFLRYKHTWELCEDSVYCLHGNYLCELEFLSLKSCHINKIEGHAFKKLNSLKDLEINKNQISLINAKSFAGLPSLKTLNLAYNGVEKIEPKSFFNFSELQRINLGFNKIRVIQPDWFKNTPKLSKVDLSSNFIQEIPKNAFRYLAKEAVNEVIVKLGNNAIVSVHPKAFDGFRKLSVLFLAHNQLKEMDGNVFVGSQLRFLDLSGNSFGCLPLKQYAAFRRFTLNLEGNGLSCGCLKEMRKRRFRLFLSSQVECKLDS